MSIPSIQETQNVPSMGRVIRTLKKKLEPLCVVPFESIEGTSKILVAGHEFHYGTENGTYRYWYCKFKRAQPKTCDASCRQSLNSKDPHLIEIIRKHRDSDLKENKCPYVSGITEKSDIMSQYNQHKEESEAIVKLNQLLDENPGCSLIELKAIAYKQNIDLTKISTRKLQNIARRYKSANHLVGTQAILQTPKTKTLSVFLRECSEYTLNSRGIESTYKYAIWASSSQIGRLRTSEHWYVDGTFRICPKPYYQLIVIMSRDAISNTASPGCYILTNSKTAISYDKIFQSLKNILTSHGELTLKLKSATVDFERGLHKGFQRNFSDVDLVGCLFHFKQALNRYAGQIGLKKKKFKTSTKNLIKNISSGCWKKDPILYFNRIKKNTKGILQQKFVKYVERQWLSFFRNQMLDYSAIDQQYRANSVVEAYNGRIKLLLPYKPNFPRFIDFLLNEESYYNLEIIRKISLGEYTHTISEPKKKRSQKKASQKRLTSKNDHSNNDNDNDDWSSTHDSFSVTVKDSEDNDENEDRDEDRYQDEDEDSDLDLNYEDLSEDHDLVAEEDQKSKLKRNHKQSIKNNPPKKVLQHKKKKNKLSSGIPEVKLQTMTIQWSLKNNNNSCRYSAFWTLYRFKLFHIHQSFRTISKMKDSSWLNKFIRLNNDMMSDKLSAIKDFSEYNYTNKFEFDKYGRFGSIAPLFAIFRCLKICNLEFRDTKLCNHCNFVYPVINSSIGPLFSLNGAALQNIDIEQAIRSYISPYMWTCECCSKISEIATKRTIGTLPTVLFIVIDLHYNALRAFKKYEEVITFDTETYTLSAAITKPAANHFALLIKNPVTTVVTSGWYEYDDMLNDGNIVPVQTEIKTLLGQKRGYILIYELNQDIKEE